MEKNQINNFHENRLRVENDKSILFFSQRTHRLRVYQKTSNPKSFYYGY